MRSLIVPLILACCPFAYGQSNVFNYLPAKDPKYQLVFYENYVLAYSEKHEQAAWVAYELCKEEVETKNAKRTNDFREDLNISTGTAKSSDYYKSGYDRGHLAPAGDFSFSSVAMSESFYMSNISPQMPAFNRGIWLKLEEQVRKWAVDNHSLYVVTGAILGDSLKRIGETEVAVPEFYYKILLDYTVPHIKSIAFLMPNDSSSLPLQHFAVTIDSIESISHQDFFPELEDYLENQLEATVFIEDWFQLEIPKDKNEEKIEGEQPKQCKGIASSTNQRCKIIFGLINGYCKYHQGQRE